LEGDERLGDEARDLDNLALQAEMGPMSAMNKKYMFQRSHEAGRGKKQAFRKLSREMRED
jgi:hypothetical protein